MYNEKELNHLSTKWIESLALEEINMEETGVVNYEDHVDPNLNLEQASIELMDEIRERFEVYINTFNHHRTSEITESKVIKMFKISNTVNDFMLFRNSLKLVISRASESVISLGFISNSSGFYAARMHSQNENESKTHEIRANLGPFNEIKWNFQGETVNLDALVRYYLTEFIRQSAQ